MMRYHYHPGDIWILCLLCLAFALTMYGQIGFWFAYRSSIFPKAWSDRLIDITVAAVIGILYLVVSAIYLSFYKMSTVWVCLVILIDANLAKIIINLISKIIFNEKFDDYVYLRIQLKWTIRDA